MKCAIFLLSLVLPAVAEIPGAKWRQLPPLPDARGVAAPFAGVSGTVLVVAGGANFPDKMPWEGGSKVWHDRVWGLAKPDGEWREIGRIPRPLAYGLSVPSGAGVACIGGSDSVQHYAECFRIVAEPGPFRVEPLPPLPIRLANMAGALVGASVFVACGSEEPGEKSATSRAFVLGPNATAWREIEPFPGKARILAAGGALAGGFVVAGGAALVPGDDGKVRREYLRDAWLFGRDGQWKQLPDMPKPAAAAPSPAPSIGGALWILGGDDGSLAGFQPVERHPGFPGTAMSLRSDGKWVDAGKVPAPRATVPVVEWRGVVVIPSGEVRPGVRSPEVWTVEPPERSGDSGRRRVRVIR